MLRQTRKMYILMVDNSLNTEVVNELESKGVRLCECI